MGHKTVKEVAQELQLSERYIHLLIKQGKIASVKYGRTRRIPESELERIKTEGIK